MSIEHAGDPRINELKNINAQNKEGKGTEKERRLGAIQEEIERCWTDLNNESRGTTNYTIPDSVQHALLGELTVPLVTDDEIVALINRISNPKTTSGAETEARTNLRSILKEKIKQSEIFRDMVSSQPNQPS